MEQRLDEEAEKEFERACLDLEREHSLAALSHLEKALRLHDNPVWYSYMGYCVAKERGQFRKGVDLCLISIGKEPGNPDHYLNLGRVHLVSGNKEEALRIFREGMGKGGNDELLRKLAILGMRKPPVFLSLPRGNPLNKYLGLLLRRLGLR